MPRLSLSVWVSYSPPQKHTLLQKPKVFFFTEKSKACNKDSSISSSFGSWSQKILVGEWDNEKGKRREWKGDNESYIAEQLLLWATGVSSFRNGNLRSEKTITPMGYCLRAVSGSAHFPALRQKDSGTGGWKTAGMRRNQRVTPSK